MPTDETQSNDGELRYQMRGVGPLTNDERAALARFSITETGPSPATGPLSVDSRSADRAARAMELLGQGVAIVESSGEIVWMNQGLSRQAPETMRRFADCCVDAIAAWHRSKSTAATLRANFRVGSNWFETIMTPLRRNDDARAEGAVALLIDATATRRVQDRLDAIDQAGVELLQLDADSIRALNAAERLRALEARVVAATRSVLGFDHFEYRLTARRTGQLELVFCSGLVPLGIGERIFARADGNGFSGIVATTGQSVLCPETDADQRYISGLPGAHSSLTVPLRLHDRVIGVLNTESTQPGHFDDEDRIGAELLGRYVALSLNILDMLVAERCETNRVIVANLGREAASALDQIAEDARALLARGDSDVMQDMAKRLLENATRSTNSSTVPSPDLAAFSAPTTSCAKACAIPSSKGKRCWWPTTKSQFGARYGRCLSSKAAWSRSLATEHRPSAPSASAPRPVGRSTWSSQMSVCPTPTGTRCSARPRARTTRLQSY